MSSYSEYGGLVDFDTTRITTDEPVDASTVRDGVVNNAAHLVQSSTQQRVNWVTLDGITGQFTPGGPLAPGQDFGTFIPFTSMLPIACFGPFPITLGKDNRTSKLVVRLAGAIAGGSTATFRVRLSPYVAIGRTGRDASWWSGPDGAPMEDAVNVLEMTTTSATPAWLTSNPTFVQYTSPPGIASATQSIVMPRSLGGDPTTARVCLFTLDVWGATTVNANLPYLYGLYAREYLG